MPFEFHPPTPETILLIGRTLSLITGFAIAAFTFARWRRAAENQARSYGRPDS